MGKIISIMSRPLRNYNIESRAHKIISQDKPAVAPKHKSDQIDYERMMKEYPEAYEEGLKKDEQLDKYLKDVYVQSHDPVAAQKPNPDRPLPLDRRQVQDFEYGVREPDKIPLGRTTLKQALQFITDHQTNPRLHSVQKISQDYSLPEDTTRNILKYFHVFEVYIPEQRRAKAKFAGPSVPRIRIVTHPRKQLVAGKEDKDDT